MAFIKIFSITHYCWRDIPAESIFSIVGMRKQKQFECYDKGIVSFEDIVRSKVALSDSQLEQVAARLSNIEYIDRDFIRNFLGVLYYPLCFLYSRHSGRSGWTHSEWCAS